jgi:prophage antirepressor-like protein
MTEINLLNPLQYNGEKLCIEYINNQPYFSAKQICRILQHTNYRSAVRTYCFPEGVTLGYTLTVGGKQKITLIDEPNLYALIVGCRTLPEAEKFRKFIFTVILPNIRKNGYFSLNENSHPLSEYTKRSVQVQKSKEINALQFALGGVEAIKKYNSENCEFVTGMTTNMVKVL